MKLIEDNADAGHIDSVASIAEESTAADFRLGYKGEDGRQRLILSSGFLSCCRG
jgi:hypothetical protein